MKLFEIKFGHLGLMYVVAEDYIEALKSFYSNGNANSRITSIVHLQGNILINK